LSLFPLPIWLSMMYGVW